MTPPDTWTGVLEENERILWQDKPSVVVMFGLLAGGTAFMFFCTWYLGWFAVVPANVIEACGEHAYRSCARIYWMSWALLPICLVATLAITGFSVLYAFGRVVISYAVTNKRALVRRAGFRRKLTSASLNDVEPTRGWHSVQFRIGRRAKLVFWGLDRNQMDLAMYHLNNRGEPLFWK